MNANSIPLTKVKSSKLYAIGHDAATQTLAVQFFGKGEPGNVYHYAAFSAEEFTAFATAESVGKHFIQHIQPHKEKHPYQNMGVPATAQQIACDEFNAAHPVGAAVTVLLDGGEVRETVTTSEAQVLSGHSAVIWLKGVSGCYLLDRVTAVKAKAA